MIKDTLGSQIKCYNKESDSIKKTKIAQSIGYLGQIVNSLIRSQEEMGIKPEIEETEEISEKSIREFIRKQILEEKIGETFRDSFLRAVIDFKKCDMSYATSMFKKIEELGLRICKNIGSGYNLIQFAEMRGYLTEEETEKSREEERSRRYS